MRPGRAGHRPEVRIAIREAWGSSLTTREIAETAGISVRTLWRWTMDLPARKVGRVKIIEMECAQ